MGSYDMKAINRKVVKSRRFRRDVMRSIQKKGFEKQKQKALEKFDKHPVTQEIRGGESASSSVEELNSTGGNLFTFIGFNKGTDPTYPVRNAIEKLIKIKFPRFSAGRKQIRVSYSVSLPTLDDLTVVSPMPWGSGSWIERLEKGISGFDSYMFKAFGEGRSGFALQAKVGGVRGAPNQSIRGTGNIRRAYITEIIKDFRKEFRK
ncbi:hypothetical protein CL634_03380 [bacterium]|nr:hypothetical protein [bacterium]